MSVEGKLTKRGERKTKLCCLISGKQATCAASEIQNIVKRQIYSDPKLASLPNFRSPQMLLTHTFTYFHRDRGIALLVYCTCMLCCFEKEEEEEKKEEHWKLCRCSKKLLCQCYLCGADIQQQPRWHRWQQCHRIAWVPLWCESASLSLLCNRHLKGRYIWRVRFAYKRDISHGQETKDKTQSIFRCVVTGGVKGRGHLICS